MAVQDMEWISVNKEKNKALFWAQYVANIPFFIIDAY